MRPLLYLIGYDIISVPVCDAACFVNACAAAGVSYHSCGRCGDCMRFRVGIIASVRVRSVCERAGICASVISRHGLPSAIASLAMRPGIILGLALCFAMCFFCSRVVWDIRIEGNSHVPESVITDTLRASGICVGTEKKSLDIDAIQNRFLILSDEISWISVNIIGNVAEVEVREVQTAPETPDYVCSNLVSTQNGRIVSFEEVRGNISVKLGEDVSRGQLLVGGIYGDETSALRFVRSSGKVFALCEREYNIEVPLEFEKKAPTGKKKIKKSLIFFDKEVKLFVNSGNLYTSCDIIVREEYFNPYGLGALPFGIRTVEYIEYTEVNARRSEEQAREQALFLLWQKFSAEAPEASLVGKKIVGRLEGDEYILSAKLESIENIAYEQEVEINILE